MKNNKVVLLYNKMSDNPGDDELDVIRQMNFIGKALKTMDYTSYQVPFSTDLDSVMKELKSIDPLVAFNLVEMVDGTGGLLYLGPAILRHLHIPYTGVPLEPMFLTTSKVLTKQQLSLMGIPSCAWYTVDQANNLDPKGTYIVKPIWEDGSLGLDEHCIFKGNDRASLAKIKKMDPNGFFIEEFIDGREFNLSILGGKQGPQVMPPAEILFKDYPEGKPRIVGYNAKWTENSFEYNHTPRTFRFKKEDAPLLEELKKIALQCWQSFGLKGYVRVDFRVDRNKKPHVLEINGNPCIAPESGYVAATKQAGLKFQEVIQRIIEDALN